MKGCTSSFKHSRVKVEENKRKAVFRNPKKLDYDVTLIDGCQITSGERTDYLVTERGNISVLIELKGADVEKACSQLFTSAQHPEVRPLLCEKKGFLIICSRYPRFDTHVLRAKQKAATMYKAGFHVVCDRGEFDIARIAAIDGPT